jgi:hypothetical protein
MSYTNSRGKLLNLHTKLIIAKCFELSILIASFFIDIIETSIRNFKYITITRPVRFNIVPDETLRIQHTNFSQLLLHSDIRLFSRIKIS